MKLNALKLDEGGLVNIPDNDRMRMSDIVSADSKFLASNNIMDYSLLLIIEKNDAP